MKKNIHPVSPPGPGLSQTPGRPARHPHTVMLTLALFLTGFGLRSAVASVGAVLGDIQDALSAGTTGISFLTTLPVLCFAAAGIAVPVLARKLGLHRSLLIALAVSVIGLLSRAVTSSFAVFLVLSTLALAGAAVANVLLPSLVKTHFPDRVGPKTSVYVVALSLGTMASAGLTEPIASFFSTWRWGLAAWAVLPVVAAIPWILARPQRTATAAAAAPKASGTRPALRDLIKSRTVLALTLFFASLSALAYIAFGWFALYLSDLGIASHVAGTMVAVLAGVSMPVSVIIARINPRHYRLVVIVLGCCFTASLAGLALAPTSGTWLWMILFGIGNGLFSLSLAFIGMRARTPETTAATSGVVQGIGYLFAGAGPILFGLLNAWTGGWTGSLVLLFVLVGLTVVSGIAASRPRFIDDDLPTAPEPAAQHGVAGTS
ncbi:MULTISPECIES: MFS transporter [Streptomyces]|uniref:MFS transporter n=1 Tax=Streptomyces TaxID=1883 RepID=UPI0006888934|nr:MULTISPECIES: MFS transporter [unclassified Streptomyces]NEC40881.1 MFS transporter [Streptomyces sp. SID8016]NEC64693.1 MFS transporter [Streptomyces sp. SID9727]